MFLIHITRNYSGLIVTHEYTVINHGSSTALRVEKLHVES